MTLSKASPFGPILSGNRKLNGTTWDIQSAGKPYNYREFGPQQRFTRQPGDNYAGDPPTIERCEVEGPTIQPYSKPCWWAFSFMHDSPLDFVPDPATQWLVCGQFHADDNIGVSLTPWLAQEFTGTTMRITTHASAANPPVQGPESERWRGTIKPYTWYDMVYYLQPAHASGRAMLQAWMNKQQIINLAGISMGYNTDVNPYPKIGIYCGTNGLVVPPHSLFTANIGEIGTASLAARITAPLSHT